MDYILDRLFNKKFMGKHCLNSVSLFVITMIVFSIRFPYHLAGDTVPQEILPISIIRDHDLFLDEYDDGKKSPPPITLKE